MEVYYTAYFINDTDSLLEIFNPIHKNVYADHCTINYKPKDLSNLNLGRKSKLKIVARVFNQKGDALLVEDLKSENKFPHITISCAESIPPMYSNQMLEEEFEKNNISYFEVPHYIDVTEGYVIKEEKKFLS